MAEIQIKPSQVPTLMIICFFGTAGETHGAAIWEIPELYGQTNALEQLVALKEHTFKIKW